MADPAKLGTLARVATLRRDRGAAALAEAGRVRAAREAALADALAIESRADDGAAAAQRMFRDNPACAQARLWRDLSAERAAASRAERLREAEKRDAAADAHEQARVDLLRADAKSVRADDLHRRARVAASTRRDEREADDRVHAPGSKR